MTPIQFIDGKNLGFGLKIAVALCATSLSGCAVVSIAGAAAGAAISLTGAVVSTGVTLTGKVIGKAIDVATLPAAVLVP